MVLVFPPFGVSTPEAFRWWDEDSRRLPASGSRLPAEPESQAAGEVFNDLEAPVCRRHPELVEIRRTLEGAGAAVAAMTGSGSTVFGLFETRLAARAASDRLMSTGRRSLVTRTATRLQAGLLAG